MKPSKISTTLLVSEIGLRSLWISQGGETFGTGITIDCLSGSGTNDPAMIDYRCHIQLEQVLEQVNQNSCQKCCQDQVPYLMVGWRDLSKLLFQIEKKKKRWNDRMINWGMDQRQKLWERMKSLIPFASARQSWNWSRPINRWNHSLLLSETWSVSCLLCFHHLAEFASARSSTLCE